jgi:hypothetical protein
MPIDPEPTDPQSADAGAPDDAMLRRYVLGLTSADESERIDELSVSSAEVATRLQGIEYDLIDAYAAGQLPREALTALRSSYVSQSDWLAEVGFADTLRAWQSRAKGAVSGAAPSVPSVPSALPVPSVPSVHTSTEPSEPSAGPVRSRDAAAATSRWMPRWWLVAAAAIALVAFGYLAFDNMSLRREIALAQRERAALDHVTRELQLRLESQQTANAEAAKELERLRVATAGTNNSGNSSSSVSGGSIVPTVLASFLLPSPVRGANEITKITLPRKTDAVRLQLPLETTHFSTLDADVRDATTNQIVWRGTGVRPIGQAVAVTLPANVLKSRTYLLELRGLRPGATPEPLAPAAFQVVIP